MAITRRTTSLPVPNDPSSLEAQYLAREIVSYQSYFAINKTVVAKYGVVPSLVLSNLVEKQKYFESSHPEFDGWFFHTHANQIKELGISEYALREAKRDLVDDGVIRVKMMGVPAKEWYFIDYSSLAKSIIGSNSCNHKKTQKDFISLKDERNVGQALSDPIGLYIEPKGSISNKPIKNKKITLPTPKRNDMFTQIAFYLSDIIQSKKEVYHPESQILGWVYPIRKLAISTLKESSVPPIRRIKRVLKWYKEHIGEPYVPVVESGKALYEKFIRLEEAMARDKESPRQPKAARGKYSSIRKTTIGDEEDD